MEGEERPARRRTFLSDTLQFMPQASPYACAAVVEPHIRIAHSVPCFLCGT